MTAAVTSVVIFSSDATELSFSDGTKLELSPCGASFVCEKSPSTRMPRGQHQLGGGMRVQQRTEFTTSEFREKVNQALEFRNRFAEHPYLCQEFLRDGSPLQLFADIKEVKWPESVENVCGKVLPGGAVQVTSVDECASLLLSVNKQEFTVEFLCKLSQKDFPTRLAKRQGKSTQKSGQNSEADGRLSADLRGDLERSASDSFRHSPQHSGIQDSPYFETLLSGKVSLRMSSQDSENLSPPSLDKRKDLVQSCTGNACQDQKSRVHQSPEIEELIAIKHGYAWVVQHHTVEHCPDCWKHPLHLASEFYPKECLRTSQVFQRERSFSGSGESDRSVEPGTSPVMLFDETRVLKDHNISEKDEKFASKNKCSGKFFDLRQQTLSNVVTSPLPCSLPLTCPATHLHKWRKDAGCKRVDPVEEDIPVGRSIKVWFSNGIIYRLSRTPQPKLHIYPGDGSIIISVDARGDFFTHVIPQGDSLEERMLCIRNPPPDCPGAAYSVAGVLRKASRLLQNMMQTDMGMIPREEKCCWKKQILSRPVMNPKPTVILEESKVEGLGRFVALTNGMVRVVFEDRMTLDLQWDFGNRLSGSVSKDDDDNDDQGLPRHLAPSFQSSKIRKSFFSSNLKRGMCQLLLPNGEYKQVPLEDPQEYNRYVMVAVEWARWVASSPEERAIFYRSQESHLPQQDWAVQNELQKIKCFEYIIENTLSPSCESKALTGDKATPKIDSPSSLSDVEVKADMLSRSFLQPREKKPSPRDTIPDFIEDALRKTSSAIRNIDSMLSKS